MTYPSRGNLYATGSAAVPGRPGEPAPYEAEPPSHSWPPFTPSPPPPPAAETAHPFPLDELLLRLGNLAMAGICALVLVAGRIALVVQNQDGQKPDDSFSFVAGLALFSLVSNVGLGITPGVRRVFRWLAIGGTVIVLFLLWIPLA